MGTQATIRPLIGCILMLVHLVQGQGTPALTAAASYKYSLTGHTGSGSGPTSIIRDQHSILFKACLTQSGLNPKRIILPIDSRRQYNRLNYQWNQRLPQVFPRGYILPVSAQEVSAVVQCGHRTAYPKLIKVVAKGGGHSYLKYSFGNSDKFVLDLQLMGQISVDPDKKSCVVGAGALTGHVISALFEKKLFIPTGTCPTVGIAGLSLGGGYGLLSRLRGLTADNIVALEMVDSSGSIRTIDRKMNPDLYWALRGAGSGSFGIVTRFKFKTHQIPASVTFAERIYELGQFAPVFQAWQDFLAGSPRKSVNTQLIIINGQIHLKMFEIHLTPVKDSDDGVQQILDKQFPELSNQSQAEIRQPPVENLSFAQFIVKTSETPGLRDPAGLRNVTRHSFTPIYFKAKSFFVSKTVGFRDVMLIARSLYQINQMSVAPKDSTVVLFDAFGGAVNELRPTDTAFVHRNSVYMVQVFYSGPAEIDGTSSDWIDEFYDTAKKVFNHTESYQNYVDNEMKDYLYRYYGQNLGRLIRVKRAVDPENYFEYPQSIPS